MNTFDVNHFKVQNNKYLFENSVWFPLTISHDALICFLKSTHKKWVFMFDPKSRWLTKVFQISNRNGKLYETKTFGWKLIDRVWCFESEKCKLRLLSIGEIWKWYRDVYTIEFIFQINYQIWRLNIITRLEKCQMIFGK